MSELGTVDATSLPHVAESHFITFYNQQQYSIKDRKYLKNKQTHVLKIKSKSQKFHCKNVPSYYLLGSSVQCQKCFCSFNFHYNNKIILHNLGVTLLNETSSIGSSILFLFSCKHFPLVLEIFQRKSIECERKKCYVFIVSRLVHIAV